MWGYLRAINDKYKDCQQQYIELYNKEYKFGRRSLSNDIQINDEFISGNHMKLVYDVDKSLVYLHDMSTNGTYVNGSIKVKGLNYVLVMMIYLN